MPFVNHTVIKIIRHCSALRNANIYHGMPVAYHKDGLVIEDWSVSVVWIISQNISC